MTLCLGGPRHGQDVELFEPQPLLDIATDQPRRPRASFVDVATATVYYLRQLEYVTPHPVTGQPDKKYTHQVYVHESLGPQEAAAVLPETVLGRWFVKEGTLQPQEAASVPGPPP